MMIVLEDLNYVVVSRVKAAGVGSFDVSLPAFGCEV
jgi:hypothetical protein